MSVTRLPMCARVLLAVSLTALSIPSRLATAGDLVSWRGLWRYADDGVNRYSDTPKFFDFAYDDSGWKTGVGRFGYGGDGETTRVSYGNNPGLKYPSTYFRHEFDWDGAVPPGTDILLMEFSRDDGAVIYLNGSLIERSNMPAGQIGHGSRSLSAVTGLAETQMFQKEVDSSLLRRGRNVMAVSVHQDAPTSSDLGFDLRLAFARKTRFFGQEELLPLPHNISQLLGLLDVTGDGAPDIVAARETNPGSMLELWINDGSGGFPAPLVIDEHAGYPETLSRIDLNGDALPDLVIGDGVRVYRNDGGGAFTLVLAVQDDVTFEPEAADLDGDGRQDIVEYAYLGNQPVLRWRRHLEGGTFAPAEVIFTAPTGPSSWNWTDFCVLDANGDGRLDLLMAVPGTSDVRLLINQGGSPPAFAVSQAAANLPNVRSVAAADLDGDGDVDFVAVRPAAALTSTPGLLETFLNDGTGSFARLPVPVSLDTWGSTLVLQDVDGDEDPDMIYSTPDVGGFLVMENDGRANWVNQRRPVTSIEGFYPLFLAVGDVDGDGHADVVQASRVRTRPVSWFRNTTGAAPVIRSFTASPDTLGDTTQVTLAWEIENATSVEIDPPVPFPPGAVSSTIPVDSQTTFTLTARNADGVTQAKRTVFMANQRWSALVPGPHLEYYGYGGSLIDLNDDNQLDLVIASYEPGVVPDGIFWAAMTPERTFGPLQLLMAGETSSTPPQVADLNGDGRADLVIGLRMSGLYWIPVLADGELGAPQRLATASFSNPIGEYAVADFDGDGDSDVVIPTFEGGLKLLLNDGSGTFSDGPLFPLPAGFAGRDMQAVDVDGDGRADVIKSRESGSPFIAWNDFPSGFTAHNLEPLYNRRIVQAHFADVNGDGHLDLLTTQLGSEIFLEIGHGDRLLGTRKAELLLPADGDRGIHLATADLDGDGDLDLVVGRTEAGVPLKYAINDGAGRFGALRPVTSGEIGDDGVGAVLLRDIDGDGDPDVVTFFNDRAAAVFNEGQPPPVIRVQQEVALSEDTPAASIRLDVKGLLSPLTVDLAWLDSSSATASDVVLGPPERVVPVPGQPGRWTLFLLPGERTVTLTVQAVDDADEEPREEGMLQFSSTGSAIFDDGPDMNSSTVILKIRASDFIFTGTGEIQRLPDGSVLLRFRGLPPRPHQIEQSINLLDWIDIGSFDPDSEGTLEYLVLPGAEPSGYFRAYDPILE